MKNQMILLVALLWSVQSFGQVSLRIAAGATLEVQEQMSIVLEGDWENEGNFLPGQGTVIFQGDANQSISNAGGETFSNMTVNKSAGLLTLQNNLTVTSQLNLTDGTINSDINTFQLGENSEATLLYTAGSISGAFARYIESSIGLRVFPLGTTGNTRSLTIDFRSPPATPGILTVSHVDPGGFFENISPLDDSGYSVDRRSVFYWDIDANGLSGGVYNLTIDGAGQQGILNSAALRVIHSDDGTTFNLVGAHGDGSGSTARRSAIDGNTIERFYLGGNSVDNPFSEVIAANQDFRAGWNLMALPLAVSNSHYQSLYPNAVSGSLMGFSNGAYTAPDSLQPGQGYFLEFPQADNVSVSGFSLNNITIPLEQDWNIIGGISGSVPVSAIVDPGGIIIPGTIYGFDGAYYPAAVIEQGRAYWIRTSTAGEITLPSQNTAMSSKPLVAARQAADLRPYTALTIADAEGRRQTLHLNVNFQEIISGSESFSKKLAQQGKSSGGRMTVAAIHQAIAEQFSLPPAPPTSLVALDARFDNNLRISESIESDIRIQAADFPLRIAASNLTSLLAEQSQRQSDDNPPSGLRYVIEAIVDGRVSSRYPLSEKAEVVISDPRVTSLKISTEATEAIIPTKFSVAQNYPNPFNPLTKINFAIPQDNTVEVVIYNLLGQTVKTLLSERLEAGHHSIIWDASNESGQPVASGIYLYQVSSGSHRAVKKMILLK